MNRERIFSGVADAKKSRPIVVFLCSGINKLIHRYQIKVAQPQPNAIQYYWDTFQHSPQVTVGKASSFSRNRGAAAASVGKE